MIQVRNLRKSFGDFEVLRGISIDIAPGTVTTLLGSTLVSVIAIPDLMYEALRIVNQWFEPVEVLSSVAVIYFALIFFISVAANQLSSFYQRKMALIAA